MRGEKKSNRRNDARGFTLVELLVVVGIIGTLATMTMVAVNGARGKARTVRAKGDLKQLSTAITLLASDTGKWPGGCPIENIADPEMDLSSAIAGITLAPPVGQTSAAGAVPVCAWTATDVSRWNGPYMKAAVDPWGTAYHFDPDYQQYVNCAGQTVGTIIPSVVSGGPNKSGWNAYDCDDITYNLE